jgi:hypothetical protein
MGFAHLNTLEKPESGDGLRRGMWAHLSKHEPGFHDPNIG